MTIIRVEKTRDYTVMSNHHLKNPDLTLKAKGLLSLILSLPEKWDFTTKGLASICKEGLECVGSAIRELEKAGYIIRNRIRDGKGRITDTEYVIHEFPQQHTSFTDDDKASRPADPNVGNPPVRTKKKTVTGPNEQTAASPCLAPPKSAYPKPENPDADTPASVFPRPENPHQLNTKQSKKEKSRTHSSIPDGSIHPSIKSIQQVREKVRAQIEYDCLIEDCDRERLDEVVEILTEVACAASPTLYVDGYEQPIAIVQERMQQLNSLHIQYVFECIDTKAKRVGNIRQYLLTCLFRAPTSMSNYYHNKAGYDLHNADLIPFPWE